MEEHFEVVFLTIFGVMGDISRGECVVSTGRESLTTLIILSIFTGGNITVGGLEE